MSNVFSIQRLDNGRYAVTERLEGSRFVKFMASLETYDEALAWIVAALRSDYQDTGLIFPSVQS